MAAHMKALAKAIDAHAKSSRTDNTPAKAVRTMIRAVFNVLGCRPFSVRTSVEEQYFTNLKSEAALRDLPTIQAMTKAYIAAVIAEPPYTDILTEVISRHVGRGGEGLGQFLSPADLADLVSHMAGEHVQRHPFPDDGRDYTVADIAGCGAGSLLLSRLRRIVSHEADLLPKVKVVGVDIDADMMRATAVQIGVGTLFKQIPLGRVHVYNCNALLDFHAGNKDLRPAFVLYDEGKANPMQAAFDLLDACNTRWKQIGEAA